MQNWIVGIDVSKKTLDLCIQPAQLELRVTNDEQGFGLLLQALQQPDLDKRCGMVVMEYTGHYGWRLQAFLTAHHIAFCQVAALQIKRSVGMIRGKDDRIDARRIAAYGWLRRSSLVAQSPTPLAIVQLRELLSLRALLVAHRAAYKSRLREGVATGIAAINSGAIALQQSLIGTLDQHIAQLDEQMDRFIAAHADLQQTYQLLRSIKGIGPIVAAYMIGCTENFCKFTDARKFNCYAGLAPFAHQSGTSIQRRRRISPLANQQIKTLLTLAAYCAIRTNAELMQYYQRRVGEGKSKMNCINVVRAKLVARMFAVVKRQSPYQPLPKAA